MPHQRAPVLLLTRPEAEARRFEARVRALAPGPWRAVISPLMEIVPVGAAGAVPDSVKGSVPVFTSAQAVPFAGEGGGRPAWCVGPRTAAAARRAGWSPREGGGDVEALLAAMLAARPEPVLHLRGVHSRGALAARLRAAGRPAEERVVYDQRALPLSEAARAVLAGDAPPVAPVAAPVTASVLAPVVAPVFSPRSAALLAAVLAAEAGNPAAPFRVIALSAAAAEPLRRWSPLVAARPDGEAMAEASAALLR